MSAATMDRLLTTVRDTAKHGRRRTIVNTPLRKSIAVRTFGDWNDPPPGFFEMDMVVHCGKSTVESYLHSLVLTDIASGWTEAIAMVVREQTLVTESVSEVRRRLPFPVRGLDVENDSAFINDTLVGYCRDNKIELTRCRAYKKNDQAWIEQKNGVVQDLHVAHLDTSELRPLRAGELLGAPSTRSSANSSSKNLGSGPFFKVAYPRSDGRKRARWG